MRRFLARLTAVATTGTNEARLREELEHHLAMQTAENVRAGLPPIEARRQALLKFGAIESVKESYRDEKGLPVLDMLLQDLRYTLRQWRKAPVFTVTATLSLAMGIGANAAVFAVIERVLMRPLPVSNPQELVFVADQRIAEERSPRFSYPFFLELRDNRVLNGVAARYSLPFNTDSNGRIARAAGELVSGSYFRVVGVGAEMGRTLTAEDDRAPSAHAVAVISDAFWRRNFNADPSVLGRDVRINNHAFTVVGVASKGFTGTDVGRATDIWVPLTMQREVGRDLLADGRTNWLEIIGRLSPGVRREAAGAELTADLERRSPDARARVPRRHLILLAGDKGSSGVRTELGPALRVLLALTGFALALAVVNVASLLAVRSAAREKEVAVRLALGAGRSRLSRQFFTESLALAALGGTAGLLLAPWAARVLVASQPRTLEIDASMDVQVFVFGLVVTALTGILVGVAPILAARRVPLTQAFALFPTAPWSGRLSIHDAIVTFQIAASFAMLVIAALLTQSLRTLSSVDPGFRADDLLLVSLDPKSAGYDANRIDGFWRDALERVSRLPGAQIVSLAGTVPLAGGRQRQPWLNAASGEKVDIDTNFVGPRYFRTLDIPLLRGREFDERDGRASTPVLIVNERLARAFWPEQDAIGKSVLLPGSRTTSAEVVGVVKDVKYQDLRAETGAMVYRPVLQTRSTDAMTLHVRASGAPGALAGAIRGEIQKLDPNVPPFQITTLEDQLDASFAQTRQAAVLTGVFGVLALLLSAVGVYGVTALVVSRRTREIGIRMALGARPSHVAGVVGRRGFTLVIAGLVLGLPAAFVLARLTGTLLHGVTAAEGLTFAGMAALLAIVSLVAFWIPARTATRMAAVAAIRYE
jgi:predicted permease